MASEKVACRECGAPVYFLRQKRPDGSTGSLNPINADPRPDGNLRLDRPAGTYRFASAAEKAAGLNNLYVSHFVDCTNPNRFRKLQRHPAPTPLPLIEVDANEDRITIAQVSPQETFEEFFAEVHPHLESTMAPADVETVRTFMGLAYTRGSIAAGARVVKAIEFILDGMKTQNTKGANENANSNEDQSNPETESSKSVETESKKSDLDRAA